MFDKSLLDGMSDVDKRAWLSELQQALLARAAGKVSVRTEATGGGQHRATEKFIPSSSAELQFLIRLLQADLGIIDSARRGAYVRFS
jgi:hypothetical protein